MDDKNQVEKSEEEKQETKTWNVIAGAIALICILGYFAFMRDKPEKKLVKTEEDLIFDQCEIALKTTLKSPSSYKMISKIVVFIDAQGEVVIQYDASNSYGVLLRGNFLCTFAIKSSNTEEYLIEKINNNGKKYDSGEVAMLRLRMLTTNN
jgi:hypothetical protein